MIPFKDKDIWSILSPIEMSIKRKIEIAGIPLKEWEININYGIKTGYNEAFIIDSVKRLEILDNCSTKEERERTDAVIRPILRGKDISRYGYKWADLWLINTHNGIKDKNERVHIDDYPAIKVHLDKYWNKIERRADQGDTPYNLRNCAYMDDFSKPKIIYPETTQSARFAYDRKGLMLDKTCFMMIVENPEYVMATLNSHLFEFAYKKLFSSVELGLNGYQYNKHALVKLPIKKLEKHIKDDAYTDEFFYRLYKLSEQEISYIEKQFILV